MKKTPNDGRLQKRLTPFNVWAIAFGCIIGWGAFVNPGKKFLPNSGVAGTAIALTIGAVIMVIIAFSYAYMVPKHPSAGGEFQFAKVCFGGSVAYWCGWFLLAAYLTNVPMNSTAIGLIVDGVFGPILKFGFHYDVAGFDVYMGEILVASAILVIFGTLNIRGVKIAGIVQTVLTVSLVLSVIVLTIAAVANPLVSKENLEPLWGFDKVNATLDYQKGTSVSIDQYVNDDVRSIAISILSTLAITPWAFVGFDTIPQAAEEFRFSYKKVSVIMIVAIAFGCFVYVVNNTITAAALSNWPELIINNDETPWLLLTAAERIMGMPGKALVGVAVSCAVLSGIMGFYIASSRLMYSMAREGYLPRLFSIIDGCYGTPKNAMVFCMMVSLVGPVLGREALGWFVDMSAIGASIGFGFTCLATLKTIRRDRDGGIFLKCMSVLGALFSGMFIVLQIVPIPGLSGVHFCNESYVMLMAWIVMGVMFFVILKRKQKHNE